LEKGKIISHKLDVASAEAVQ